MVLICISHCILSIMYTASSFVVNYCWTLSFPSPLPPTASSLLFYLFIYNSLLSYVSKEKLCAIEATYCVYCNHTTLSAHFVTIINSCSACCFSAENLHSHLECHNIEYLQFAFRWMNNLLMREMPLHCVIRLWDTYLVNILNAF